MTAMASRKNAEAPVPMMLPIDLNCWKRPCQRERRRRDRGDRERDGERMAEREEQTDRNRPLALLHQLAHDIVDRGDVIGIDRVPQSEHVGEDRGAEKRRPVGERDRPPRSRSRR